MDTIATSGRGIGTVGTLDAAPARSAEAEELLLVGDLARSTGKTVRALHLYEELGLLAPHARSKGRYRLYGNDALLRVRWISKMQDMGLSLAEITELVRGWETSGSAPHAMDKVRKVFEVRLQQTQEQLRRLRELEEELVASIQYLELCNHQCDPVRETRSCSCCELHAPEVHPPDLVRGVASGT